MNGAQALVECLRREGVEVLFGYPGGAVLDLYNALRESGIRHILTRHEQGAVHAADGYARASGRPGVCVATSGPGATNLVTGLATAYMDSSPVVALTGQVSTSQLGTDSFQEADITGITLPVTKHNYLVKDVGALTRVVREAFHIVSTGRPGPVLVDLPRDVLAQAVGEFSYPPAVKLPGYRPPPRGHSGHLRQVRRAVRLLAGASRPVILAGGGVILSEGSAELGELVGATGIPVASTFMGLGAFPGDHPLSLGMAGMHGTYWSNRAIREADVILAAGVRFDDRLTGKVDKFAPRAGIIHVDIDAAEVGKNVAAHIPIVGDAGAVLAALTREWLAGAHLVVAPERWVETLGRWLDQIEGWRAAQPLRYSQDCASVKPQAVVQELHRATRGQAIITTDVGQHQMWVAQYYPFTRPRTLISSGGLGTMGFGLPAAVGARVARPEELVVNVTGDGSLLMNCQELATVAEQGLPIKILVFNNGYLGMVRQWQELFYGRRYSSVRLANPDFLQLARAFGLAAERAERTEDVRDVLHWALAEDGPALVDFRISPEENVLPMIPPGQSGDAAILASSGLE